jgi:hypothetical protein
MVGWICALAAERSVAIGVMDELYDEDQATAQYTLGRISHHNIILANLPSGQIGTSAAARVAEELKSRFPSLQFGLLVGIGGGVLSETADVRLGDVVVSQPQGYYGGVVIP